MIIMDIMFFLWVVIQGLVSHSAGAVDTTAKVLLVRGTRAIVHLHLV